MSHSVVSSTLHHDPGTDCYFHKINATMTPSPKQNKKNQNKQTNKQTDKTKKQYMVMEQRSFGHKIRFYRSYFPSLVQSSMKITTCTVNVFFSFFRVIFLSKSVHLLVEYIKYRYLIPGSLTLVKHIIYKDISIC